MSKWTRVDFVFRPLTDDEVASVREGLRQGLSLAEAAQGVGRLSREADICLWRNLGRELDKREPMF